MDRKEYVCNQLYKQHALLRKGSWTDADKLEYMELNIAPYSRYWRMGMKKSLKHAIKLLREEEAKADRKTEPTGYNLSPVEDEPTISKMEQVEGEPQTENPCDGCVCDDGKHLMYCMNCKGIAWKTEPPKVEDEPQTEYPRCVINGTPFDECGFCEQFNCDTCKCEAQTERSE